MNSPRQTNAVLYALNVAAIAHKNQKRKGLDKEPYVNHLIEVAFLITDVAKVESIEVIQSAILHDILEDTHVTQEALSNQFDSKVVSIVSALSDDKSLSLIARRQHQIEHLKNAPREVKLIKLADICSNIVSIPENWDSVRIKSYIDWIDQVASLCLDSSVELAEEYRIRSAKVKNTNAL